MKRSELEREFEEQIEGLLALDGYAFATEIGQQWSYGEGIFRVLPQGTCCLTMVQSERQQKENPASTVLAHAIGAIGNPLIPRYTYEIHTEAQLREFARLQLKALDLVGGFEDE